MLHDGLSAMVTSTYRYAFVVEYGPDVVGMHTIHHKSKNTRLLSGGSDESETRYATKALCRGTEQLVLPFCDVVLADP
jgi:hypothetical protein